MTILPEMSFVLFSLLLAASALGKLDAWPSWSASVSGWAPTPQVAGFVRWTLPSLEVIVTILLVTYPSLGLAVAALLFVAMGLGVLGLAREAEGAQCGCFGQLGHGTIGRSLAFRNLLLGCWAFLAAEVAAGTHVRGLDTTQILGLSVAGISALLLMQVRVLAQATSTSEGEA